METQLKIRRVGNYSTITGAQSECKKCHNADYGDVLIEDICGRCLLADLAQLREDAKAADEEHAKLVELSDLYQDLRSALDEAWKVITDLRDLARTGLPCGGYTEEEWAMHRLNRIAGDLTAWLEQYPDLP